MPVTETAFRAAVLPFTLHEEGGLSLDKGDKGNWTGGVVGRGVLKGTKYGIAASAHPSLDIRHLTLEQACDIYWHEYCVQPGFDRLALPLLLPVFDAGVNCGPARARAWLAAVADKTTEADQIRAFSALNLAYHKRLKTWRRYGAVWCGRIGRAEAQALRLLAAAPQSVVPRAAAPTAVTARPAPRAADQPPAHPFIAWLAALLAPAPQPAKA